MGFRGSHPRRPTIGGHRVQFATRCPAASPLLWAQRSHKTTHTIVTHHTVLPNAALLMYPPQLLIPLILTLSMQRGAMRPKVQDGRSTSRSLGTIDVSYAGTPASTALDRSYPAAAAEPFFGMIASSLSLVISNACCAITCGG